MEDVTQSPAPEAAVTPAPEAAPAPAPDTPIGGDVTPPEGGSAPEWKPNFKVKAYDKEYDIPEEYRAFITKENEESFRKTFSKAFAVEEMTEKNKKYLSQYEDVNKKYQEVDKNFTSLARAVDKVEKLRDNGDFDSLFSMLKVDEKALQAWMYNKLRLKELPPEQQDIYNKKQEYQKQLYDKDEQLEYYKTQFESMRTQSEQARIEAGHKAVDDAISKPEIAAIAKSFDERLGQEGAFKDEVLQRAAFHEQRTGKTLSVDEAIKNVLKVLSAQPQTSGAAAQNTLPPQADKKPTLPNIAGKTTSPAAQKITSVEDLRKLRSAVIASQASN